ncbi:unannotated protein [freshwater metagenome]|uniref:Unannotated protein n=1 Tax=freshwater metagenome TaxID=449393 RepID=A0A6J6U2D6_9ZZZZ
MTVAPHRPARPTARPGAQPAPGPPGPSAAADGPHPAIDRRLLVLLAFVGCASPLAVDLYLASFPAMARDLGTTPAMVRLTLTAYLVGVALGQPLWGPVSQRHGRRATLVASGLAAVVASVLVVLAPTIELLVAARFLQAVAASAGIVVARAMISDLAHRYDGLRALATMMTIHGLVPVVGPVLGGALATALPWRAVLAVLALVMASQLVVSLRWVPETLPSHRRSARVELGDLRRVVRRPAYLSAALVLGLAVATMMAFVACSPFVYQELLGLSPLQYGLAGTVNALGMTVGGLVSVALARRRVHPSRTLALTAPALVSATLLVLLAAASPWPGLLVLPALLSALCCSLLTTCSMGLAMEQAQDLPGAGSAMLGLFMFGVGAALTPLAGLGSGPGGATVSAVPMGLLMTGCAVLLAAVVAVDARRRRAGAWADGFGSGPPEPVDAPPLTVSRTFSPQSLVN